MYIYGKPTICTSSSHFATGAQSAAPAPRGRYPIHPTDGGLWKYQRKIVDSTCWKVDLYWIYISYYILLWNHITFNHGKKEKHVNYQRMDCEPSKHALIRWDGRFSCQNAGWTPAVDGHTNNIQPCCASKGNWNAQYPRNTTIHFGRGVLNSDTPNGR